MRKIRVLLLALLLSVLTTPIASAADTCSPLNVPSLADDNLTITLVSMTKTEKTGSFQLTINYKMLNGTSDKKIDEGSFKIFYTDGTSEPQYGFFGTFFPGDGKERSYTWEYLKSKTPMNISYNAGFFSSAPSSLKLNWAPPGQACNLVSPAAKAAAEKAAADAKTAADAKAIADKAAADAKAAADKAAADAKAAADKAAADKAAADAKAIADKAAADAKAIADKAAADAKAIADKAAADAKAIADKAAADKAAADKAAADAKAAADKAAADKAAADAKAIADKAAADAKAIADKAAAAEAADWARAAAQDAADKAAAAEVKAKVQAAKKKTTITCIKGKLTKKVIGINPKCPSGYKKK